MSLRKPLLRALDLVPRQTMRTLIRFLITGRFDYYRAAAEAVLHMAYPLNVDRFSASLIEDAIALARSRFPGAPIHYLTDLSSGKWRLDFKRLGVVEIEDPRAIPDDGEPRVFVCVFDSDEKLLASLRVIRELPNAYFFLPRSRKPPARYFHRSDLARMVLQEEAVRGGRDVFFDLADFENLIQAIDVTRHLPGDYVEVGMFASNSARVALDYMRRVGIDRRCYLLDTYAGSMCDAARSSPDAAWTGLRSDSARLRMQRTLPPYHTMEVIPVDIVSEQLPEAIGKIALCNVDVDSFDAVASALEKLAPRIVKGGIMIVEDQGHTPCMGGAYLALADFLETDIAEPFVPIHMGSGQAFLIRGVEL